MRVQLVRTRDGLAADSRHDEEMLEKLLPGDVVSAEVKRSRNPAFHRKAFAMLKAVYDNQEHFDDFDRFREWLQIAAGIVDTTIGPDGQTYYTVKSLAWHKMDDITFAETYQALITAAYEQGHEWVLERFA